MKAKPILFQGEMIRALLREIEKPGTGKTMTRRLRGLETFNKVPDAYSIQEYRRGLGYPASIGHYWAGFKQLGRHDGASLAYAKCPYGQPGDMLWVRETHHLSHTNAVTYRADFNYNPFSDDECGEDCSMVGEKWKPSIFMPQWASRITLEITDVRVERLQDISEADAEAEGIERFMDGHKTPGEISESQTNFTWGKSAGICFRRLWQSINGPESWDANPWVWIVEFRPILANVDAVLADPSQFGIKQVA